MQYFDMRIELKGDRYPAGHSHSENAYEEDPHSAFEKVARNYVRDFARKFYPMTMSGNPLDNRAAIREAIEHIQSARVVLAANPKSFPALASKLLLDLDAEAARALARNALSFRCEPPR